MKITRIAQQTKRTERYSIFVDDVYSFSLSADALLTQGLFKGQDVTTVQIAELKKASNDDKLYARALRYAALRPRATMEVTGYLKRLDSPTPLIEQITNKLHQVGILDDTLFARAYVHDRALLRPTSRRTMILELRKKQISAEIVAQVLEEYATSDQTALAEIVHRKKQQARYKDPIKLMQYLHRKGFRYDDITAVLKQDNNETTIDFESES